jgi:hypothetical protein
VRFRTFSFLVCWLSGLAGFGASGQTMPSAADRFEAGLRVLAAQPADPCSAEPVQGAKLGVRDVDLLEIAADLLTDGLNQLGTHGDGASQATAVLERMQRGSNKLLAQWPANNRFGFQVLDLEPILLIQLSLQSHARYFVYAKPATWDGKRNVSWHQAGADDVTFEHDVPRTWLTIYPLSRGPSGNPRFLASFGVSGCAGSYGTVYDVREWRPGTSDYGLEQVIKQEGAVGLDDRREGERVSAKQPFPLAGKLETGGPRLSLPYCWFSALDTWDDPSLCAADTYDLSRDEVRFDSRIYNRPDLAPIAKAIEYAGKRDLRAVRGYCTSDAVARSLVGYGPLPVTAEDLSVRKIGQDRERVRLDEEANISFEVVKRGTEWRVSSFRVRSQ